MMSKKITTVALMALLASSTAFTPAPRNAMNVKVSSSVSNDLPYFLEIKESSKQEERITSDPTSMQNAAATMEAAPKKKAAPKGKGGAEHKEGIFSPVVLAAKSVLGDDQLNKIRAKAISMHSDVIAGFVETHQWPTGQAALKALFAVADKNKNGQIEEEELVAALHTLGFTWLQEKQIRGIFARADTDENGAIDLEEWMNEAPMTLRTNLTKLAKKNGGELGFLV